MPIGFWYWLILVLAVIFSWWDLPGDRPWYRARGWHIWLFVLLVIIGWHLFGAPWTALVSSGGR